MIGVYFSISSFLTILILVCIFFSKKRVKNSETIIYGKLLIITMIGLFLEIITCIWVAAGVPIEFTIYKIFSKLTSSYYAVWSCLFLNYLLNLCNYKENRNKIFNFINIFIVLITILLPVSFLIKDNIIIPQGMSIYLTYGLCFIFSIVDIVICIKYRKKIVGSKFTPLYTLIVLGGLAFALAIFFPQLFIIGYVFSLIVIIMYFTIENPDVKMLAQLELARDQAEKANNAKTEFLSSMSHEIRTPLNAIVGFSECIANSDDIVSARSDAKDIIMASQNLLEIVNGILDISKIEANKMEIIETDYELEPILKNLEKLMIPRIGEKPIEFKSNFALDLPAVLHGDSGKLKQIITNILTNAVKYTEEGRIDFNVNCINEKDTCSLVISVEDTGRGIKPEKINTLFNKFERLDEDKNTTTEGTGLGLAITKKLTEMMGGKIIVQSKYGIGSKFTIYIKQRIVSMYKKEEDIIETTELLDLTGKKVLVVDDNKMNLKVASRILKTYNISIFESESGIECIERIKANEKYDLILLDDMMPRLTGTETLKKLKELPNFNIPVIALTANALEGMREKYLQDGFDDYLSKPFNKVELEIILKKYINTKVNIEDIKFPTKNIELPQKQEEQKQFNDKKILIVDDNKLNIKVAEMMLKKYNTQIESVLSGFECLEKIKTNKYDLIFMDYMMPEMDGIETLHKLKEIENFTTPVVVLTADAVEGAKERFLNEGFNDYISKPIDKNLLDQIMTKYLN